VEKRAGRGEEDGYLLLLKEMIVVVKRNLTGPGA
jgi:hypothetical protein